MAINTEVFIALAAAVIGLIGVAAVFMRKRSKSTRRRGVSNSGLGGLGTLADKVHLPSDDPLWQAHAKATSGRKPKNRKAWAAGSAGGLGAGYVDSHGGCGGGCGGGGCGGGS